MTRSTRLLVGIAVSGAIALLGLPGCDRGESGADADTTDLSWEGQALQSIGYTTADLTAIDDEATADPTRGAGGDRHKQRHPRLRLFFTQHTLHAEAVVQTDEGTKT